jgi:CRP/FNR family cyclic AMP-dependent transcriptional regulator
METVEQSLAPHPFLRDVPAPQLARLAACGILVRYDAGQHIFDEGESATRFFLLIEGRVELQTFTPGHGAAPIATIQAGDALGWSWLFPPYRWHFDAIAREPTQMVALDARCFRERCEADHDLGYIILYRIAFIMMYRLQRTRLQLLDVYGTWPGATALRNRTETIGGYGKPWRRP